MNDVLSKYEDVKNHIQGGILVGAHKSVHQRPGQYTFNTLHDEFPVVANAVRGTLSDCFYQDAKIPEFWRKADQAFWDLIL